MFKLLTLMPLLFVFSISYVQTMEEDGQPREAERKEWFGKHFSTQRENHKFFDIEVSSVAADTDTDVDADAFHFFERAIYADSLKVLLERANIQGAHLINEMIGKEKTLRETYPDLAFKDNFAQSRFFAIYQNSEPDSFSIPLYAGKEEADAFYANGNLGSLVPGFFHNIRGYPWFSENADNSIFLVQRPSSTPEATAQTVKLLQNLAQESHCPSTISAEKLKYLHDQFEEFTDVCASIKGKLGEKLIEYPSSLKEQNTLPEPDKPGKKANRNTLAFVKKLDEADIAEVFHKNILIFTACINRMRFDLEGRFFETEKKVHEINSKNQVDQHTSTTHPELGLQLKLLQMKAEKIKEAIALIRQELKTPNSNREELKARLKTCQETYRGINTPIAELSKTKKEIEYPRIKEQKVISDIYEYLQEKYLELIEKYKDICNPKDFNFGCSEQLLIDHLFRVNFDNTVVSVRDRVNGKALDTLVFLIHSTMTPCKTCSLAIALEAIHEKGRIFNFFSFLRKVLKREFKGIVVVSFSKEYRPTHPEKFYGFAFKVSNHIPPIEDFYWLVNCPPCLS
ncbi:hypothetical protein [Candidatus Odyssella acanthamoebae]|uniref:Uncharacterized protein n=1 Tax=Candidatus Odyssella acanthamoebae TaxID=91604 RepID=A0A077AUT8_9PROT|nr:hypothetical protein [Candidatus Paracaedibacter acanthamoebae]AIK96176.1 hypothetical protein ID47_04585 [Candidatus Paracaedibacter acanthamoebae]